MIEKISFIGAGDVGATAAFLCAHQNLAEQIVLLDIQKNLAEGKALDISHSLGQKGNIIQIMGTDSYDYIANSDLVVITAGKAISTSTNYSRDDLAKDNMKIFASIFELAGDNLKNSIVIVVTNPVDTLSTWVHQNTELEANKIIGFGNVLDSMRYQYYTNDSDQTVVGEHGNDMVLLGNMSEEVKSNVVNGAKHVVELLQNRSTMYAPAIGISKLVNAIVNDTREILPVSTTLNGLEGLDDVSIGAKCVIGKYGVSEVIAASSYMDEQVVDSIKKTATKIRSELGN